MACCALVSVCSAAFASSDPATTLTSRLNTRLETESGTYAVAFTDLSTGLSVGLNDTLVMHAASTMKVPVMIRTYQRAEAGAFSLSDSIRVHNAFASIVDGSTFSLDISGQSDDWIEKQLGRSVSIRDLVTHMIITSSNLATNLLVELLDPVQITRAMRDLGAETIQVRRGVMDLKAYNRGLNNVTSARDLLRMFKALALHQVASDSSCTDMIGILKQQRYRDKIPGRLPPDVQVAHKTGAISNIHHDAGIVFLPDGRRYVLVLMSRGIKHHSQSAAVMADLSRLIYDFMIQYTQKQQ
jgi:beta-lactamase class A